MDKDYNQANSLNAAVAANSHTLNEERIDPPRKTNRMPKADKGNETVHLREDKFLMDAF